MFTQCPQCNAIFQLSASQLSAANGDVRCGHCLSVFNALNHLSEDPPSAQKITATENLTHEVNELSGESEEIPASIEQTEARIDSTNDVFSDIISKVKEQDISAEEIDRFEEFLATDTLPTDESLTTSDSFSGEHSLSTDNALFTGDSVPDNTINTDVIETTTSEKITVSTDDTNVGDINVATTILDTDINFGDDEFAEFDAYLDGSEAVPTRNATQHNDKTNANNDDSIIIEATETSPRPETTDTAENQSSLAIDAQTVDIPSLILDDLHAAEAGRLRSSSTLWIIGSLLLMLTLVLQVIYYSRDELARDTRLRPWLTQACEVLNCTLSQPYDIKQIEIIGRDVRSHPSADKALIVSTTLINGATFVQPFPLLTIVFSDINGTKIAQRRFTPREYLSNTSDLETGMTPDMPVRIDLELVDPGKAAVNYEFHTEIDPRQTRPLT